MNDEETQVPREDLMQDLKLKVAFGDYEKRSDDRYAKKIVERIVFGVIVIFALAALFFIFTKVGLPVPSL